MTFSKNGIAIAVIGIEMLLSAVGVEFEAGSVAKMVEGLVVLVSFLLMVWNQRDRVDVKNFFLKLR